jgi:hypothetical protein
MHVVQENVFAFKNANSQIEAKDVAAICQLIRQTTKRRRATFSWRHPISRRRRQ